jgi:hypothetical protein
MMVGQDNKFEDILQDIEITARKMKHVDFPCAEFELKEDGKLSTDLSGGVGAFFVRSVLAQMQISEHHIFNWHLQNKYMQYLVFNYYLERCMPETYSLTALLNTDEGKNLVTGLFQQNYFLKATLGHGSGTAKNFDRTAEFNKILTSYSNKADFEEEWIIQKRLNFIGEYRVHTFGKDLIHGLTFTMSGEGSLHINAEEYLTEFLSKVPDSLFIGTLIGWDIGLDDHNHFYIIEANFTGFHPQYRRGFQTTGYVEDNSYGPTCCALINEYFNLHHGCFIHAISVGLLSVFKFYQDTLIFIHLLQNSNLILIQKSNDGILPPVIIYWGSLNNGQLTTLISYFKLVGFTDTYYILVEKGLEIEAYREFASFKNTQLVYEQSLFTKGQLEVIDQFNYLRKKAFCYYHLLRMLRLTTAIMF